NTERVCTIVRSPELMVALLNYGETVRSAIGGSYVIPTWVAVSRQSEKSRSIQGETVIVAFTGTKLPVWSVSTSCARTPLIVQLPAAVPTDTPWLAAIPLCQFKTTSEALLPGATKRTSKNVCEVRFEPEMLTEKEVPAATVVRSKRRSVTTGTGSNKFGT